MELAVDFFRQGAGDAFDLLQVLDAGVDHAAQAAKARQQALAALGAYAFDLLQARGLARLGALGAHAGDGEAVRLVADLRHQHQRRRFLAQLLRGPAVDEHQRLQADAPPFPFGDADDQADVQPQFGEHLARHLDLALAAVDQHHVRHDAVAVGDLFVAAHQHLAHRRVIVAGGDVVDVVAAVFAVLHLVVVEHHARGLRGLALRVRDVEALHPQRVDVFRLQLQRLHQRARARLLRALLRQQPRQRDLRALLRQLQPFAALVMRLEDQVDAVAALLLQGLHQRRVVEFDIQDQRAGDELLGVVLDQEGGQHFKLDRLFRDRGGVADVVGEVGAVAQVAAAAHHRQVDAGAPALHQHGDDVDVGVAGGFHALLMQHARQRLDLVAHTGGQFEFEFAGVGVHFLFQVGHHFALAATQEARGVFDVGLVVVLADQVHARPAAAADLVQQAWAGAVGIHAVFAGADQEYLLQDLHRFLDRPRAGERAEILVLLVHRAAVVDHARRIAAGDLQVGIGFIVAEQDVEARAQGLDQVILKDQRFGFAVGDGGFQPRDTLDHHRDARAAEVFLEVAGDAFLQVARLADVEHLYVGVEIAVHARQVGQLGHGGQHLFARIGCGFQFSHTIIFSLRLFDDDEGDGVFFLVADRHLYRQLMLFHEFLQHPAADDHRLAAGRVEHLRGRPGHRHAHSQADRLGERFLGGEAGGDEADAARRVLGLARQVLFHLLRTEDLGGETVAVARQGRLDARDLADVGTDAVDHLAGPRRVETMMAFISRTAFSQPTNTEWATMAWPILSSAISGIAAMACTLV